MGLGTHAADVGRTLLRIGQVEGADADAMANPAIDIKLVGALPVFVCWVNYAFGLMLIGGASLLLSVIHVRPIGGCSCACRDCDE